MKKYNIVLTLLLCLSLIFCFVIYLTKKEPKKMIIFEREHKLLFVNTSDLIAFRASNYFGSTENLKKISQELLLSIKSDRKLLLNSNDYLYYFFDNNINNLKIEESESFDYTVFVLNKFVNEKNPRIDYKNYIVNLYFKKKTLYKYKYSWYMNSSLLVPYSIYINYSRLLEREVFTKKLCDRESFEPIVIGISGNYSYLESDVTKYFVMHKNLASEVVRQIDCNPNAIKDDNHLIVIREYLDKASKGEVSLLVY